MKFQEPVIYLEGIPKVANLYSMSIGGRDSLTLKEHTVAVIRAYERHFEGRGILGMPNEQFKLLLSVHDLGKPIAVKTGRLQDQHSVTLSVLEEIRHETNYPEEWWKPIACLIDGDPVGAHLNSKHAKPQTESLAVLEKMRSCLKVSRAALWTTLMTYYQCDVLGYPSLRQKVFVMDQQDNPIFADIGITFVFAIPEEAKRFESLRAAWFGTSKV